MSTEDPESAGEPTSAPSGSSRKGLTPRTASLLGALPVVLGVLLLAGFAGWLVLPEDGGTAVEQPAEPASPSPASQAYRDIAPAAPVRLLIPSLDVKAPVVSIQTTTNAQGQVVLNPPQDVDITGWWNESARPGAESGQVVITGHTFSGGEGVFDQLPQAKEGERVAVVTERGRVRYEITSTRVLSREEVAQQARDLFGQQGGSGRLVLISCTDYENGVYHSNVIVTARPLGQPVA